MKEPQRGVILETVHPHWIPLGNGVWIGIQTTARIHTLRRRKNQSKGYIFVGIEDEASIGAGVLIVLNVTIGRAAIVEARSVAGMLGSIEDGRPSKIHRSHYQTLPTDGFENNAERLRSQPLATGGED